MTVLKSPSRGWNPLVSDQVWLAALVGAAAIPVTNIATIIVGQFTDVTASAWVLAGSVVVWLVGVYSGWNMYSLLPLYVSHGHTRREAFQVWGVSTVAIAVVSAVIMAVGFAVEHAVYAWRDFPGRPDDMYLFGTIDRWYTLAPQYLIVFAVWGGVGGMIGAGIYRGANSAWLLSVPAAILLGAAGVFDTSTGGFMGFLRRVVPSFEYHNSAVSLLVTALALAATVAIAWVIARDTPLRAK